MNASGNGSSGPLYMSAEEAGIVEEEFTPAGTKYKQDAYGQWVPAINPGQIRGPNAGSSESQREYTEMDSSYHTVTPVLKEMQALKDRLDQRADYDPRTGELQYMIGGPKRDALQKQYDHLLHHVLPYQMAQGAQADAWLAENPAPGSEHSLVQQLERQRAIRAQAEAIADQRALEAQAQQIARFRGA